MSSFEYPQKQYVKYVPVGYANTHNTVLAYAFWLLGFFGAHRFFLGRPISGVIWFFTLGLLGIGWIIDLFLIPGMIRQNNQRYPMGSIDYNLTWGLLWLGGWIGLHRFYQGKIVTGIIYVLTFGLFGIGWIYDLLTLNEQIAEVNQMRLEQFQWEPIHGPYSKMMV